MQLIKEEYRHIQLPRILSQVCCQKKFYQRKGIEELLKVIQNDQFLNLYYCKLLKLEPDDNQAWSQGIRKLGIGGNLEIMSQAALSHLEAKQYTHKSSTNFLNLVLDFEESFNKLKSRNHRKMFLLGFYLLFCNIIKNGKATIDYPQFLTSFVSEVKAFSEFGDWYLYSLIVFSEYLSEEELYSTVGTGENSMPRLLSKLSPEQIDEAFIKFLHYGHAIHDNDFILYKKVFV